MHQLHRSVEKLPPGPLVDRVLLKQAHVSCVGSARDERMIEEIADILWSFKHDVKARPHKRDPAVEAQRALELSGRHPGHDDFLLHGQWRSSQNLIAARQGHLRQSIPAAVPSEIAAVMEQACRPKQDVKPLPMSVQHLHKKQSGSAGSVVEATLNKWLASPEGQAWQKERAEMYAVDEVAVDEVV